MRYWHLSMAHKPQIVQQKSCERQKQADLDNIHMALTLLASGCYLGTPRHSGVGPSLEIPAAANDAHWAVQRERDSQQSPFASLPRTEMTGLLSYRTTERINNFWTQHNCLSLPSDTAAQRAIICVALPQALRPPCTRISVRTTVRFLIRKAVKGCYSCATFADSRFAFALVPR